MKKPLLLLVFLALGCISAMFIRKFVREQNPKHFPDFVDVAHISKAKMWNNNGNFYLNKKQLETLKQELSKMTYVSNMEIKAGAKAVTVTIDNKDYTIVTRTNGEFAQITMPKTETNDSEELVFETNGLNLDNYGKTK